MVASPIPRALVDAPLESIQGFDIRLPSAQLADLIQINCINRVRGAFRVRSAEQEGYLFFSAGDLVHAACAGQVGLDAVVVMLGWRGGSIEPCSLPWPAESTIGMGADVLLLHAAQRLDERLRSADRKVTTKVVRRVSWEEAAAYGEAAAREPSSGAAGVDAGSADGAGFDGAGFDAASLDAVNFGTGGEAAAFEAPAGDAPGFHPGGIGASASAWAEPASAAGAAPERTSEPSGLALRSLLSVETLARLEVTRVTPEGDIQHSRRGASTDLADTAFFCQRLASLIGEGLGLGECRALACESVKEGIVVFKGRAIVGARGQRRDLEFVLAKVGLS